MKKWIVEFSKPVYGGRVMDWKEVKAPSESEARIKIMQEIDGALPISCTEKQ